MEAVLSEPHITTPEVTQEPFSYASAEKLDELRNAQNALVDTAGIQALEDLQDNPAEVMLRGDTYVATARADAMGRVDELIDDYLAPHIDKEADPEAYQAARDNVQRYSITQMDDATWHRGDYDENGRHLPGTSGAAKAHNEHQALLAANAPVGPTEPRVDATEVLPAVASPEMQAYNEAVAPLTDARNELARISILRRRQWHKKGSKNQALESEFSQALDAYTEAYTRAGALAIEALRVQPLTDGETLEDRGNNLRQAALLGTMQEQTNFSNAEKAFLESEGGKRAKVIRWMAERKRNMFAVNAATGTAIGAGGKALIGKFVKTAAIAAVPVTAGVGVGLVLGNRVAKSALQAGVNTRVQQHNLREKRANEDAKLTESMMGANVTDETVGYGSLAAMSNNVLRAVIDSRIEKDRRSNRNRVIGSMAVTGAFSAASIGVMEVLKHNPQITEAIRNRLPIDRLNASDNRPQLLPSNNQTALSDARRSVGQILNPTEVPGNPATTAEAIAAQAGITPNIQTVSGAGMIETMQNGFHVSPDEAAYIHQALINSNMYDGANIPGAILLDGEVVNYVNGSNGDGMYRFSNAALQVVAQARSHYAQSA